MKTFLITTLSYHLQVDMRTSFSKKTKTLLSATVEDMQIKLEATKKLHREASSKGEESQALVYTKEIESLEQEMSLLQAAFPNAREMLSSPMAKI